MKAITVTRRTVTSSDLVEYGLPLDDCAHRKAELEALDRAAVEAAARRHLHPEVATYPAKFPHLDEHQQLV
ncbi:MAG TPA: hypothetical protein VF173_19165 [Thermoanaerobaculia bacterium]|nr:hypothetical protein [Thermoanaerobaculia bacterium]